MCAPLTTLEEIQQIKIQDNKWQAWDADRNLLTKTCHEKHLNYCPNEDPPMYVQANK